jgi:O-antigen ligase
VDAKSSLAWRFEMWKVVVNDVLPYHLWFGKGYSIDPTDIFLAEESVKRGFQNDFEMSVRTGDFHNGPLSVLVPFGIVGAVPLMLFLIAGGRAIYRNYKQSDPDTKNINTFLFSYFIAQLIYFVFFFGGIEGDLWVFASTVGISLTINGGVKQRVAQAMPKGATQTGTLPGSGLTPAPA